SVGRLDDRLDVSCPDVSGEAQHVDCDGIVLVGVEACHEQLAVSPGPPDDIVAQLHRHSVHARGTHHGEAVMYLARRKKRPFRQDEGAGSACIAADLTVVHASTCHEASVIAEELHLPRAALTIAGVLYLRAPAKA